MFVPLFPFPVPIPLIGEQLLPPNWPALPRHGLTAESVILSSPGEKKDRFTHLSQSGKSVWVGGRNPIEGVRLAAGGAKRPPRGVPRGAFPSGRFFGDFLIGEKVTRVQGGAPASGEAGATSPAQTPRALRPLYKKRIPDACQQIAGRRRHKGAAGRAVPALLLPAGADGLGRLLDRVDHRLPLHPALL